MLHLINQYNQHQYLPQLASMHRLRKRVCCDKLKWVNNNIQVINGMEFDQFDTPEAQYLVHININGEVDACTRLLPTTGAYLLGDQFPEIVEFTEIPKAHDVWETSRYCVDSNAPKRMMGILAAGMLEFAIMNKIKSFVSISDTRVEPLIKRYGWTPNRLGNTIDTGTDISVAEEFRVSIQTYKEVCKKTFLLPYKVIQNIEEIITEIKHAA